MKRFCRGMVHGMLLAVGSLAFVGLFFGILTGLYNFCKHFHINQFVGDGIFLVGLYSLIFGIAEVLKGDKK